MLYTSPIGTRRKRLENLGERSRISYIKTLNLIFVSSEKKSKRVLNCDRVAKERQREDSLFRVGGRI